MNAFAFIDGDWKAIKSAHCFHEGIGFVKLYSIRAHDGDDWKVMELGKELHLVGASND
jgi:hypothetical protein